MKVVPRLVLYCECGYQRLASNLTVNLSSDHIFEEKGQELPIECPQCEHFLMYWVLE